MSLPTKVANNKHLLHFNFKIMKNLLKMLFTAAFVMAIVAFFAFSPATEEEVVDYYYFEWDGTSIGTHIPDENVCPDITGLPCAMGFEEEDLETINPPVLKSQVQSDPETYVDDERFEEE